MYGIGISVIGDITIFSLLILNNNNHLLGRVKIITCHHDKKKRKILSRRRAGPRITSLQLTILNVLFETTREVARNIYNNILRKDKG